MNTTPDDEQESIDQAIAKFDPRAYPALVHATSAPYVHDDYSAARLLRHAQDDEALLSREPYKPLKKVMASDEAELRRLDHFIQQQPSHSKELRQRLLDGGIAMDKIDAYMHAFANMWVDGYAARIKSQEMQSIMASVAEHDRMYHPRYAGVHVINKPSPEVAPLFAAKEMAMIFRVNASMIECALYNYFNVHEDPRSQSINRAYVRRGMYCVKPPHGHWKEANYLNSYSLATTVPEQFAQTYTDATKGRGVPTIVSAPIPAIQSRVVAFSGFIENMDLDQLEFVVAPPVSDLTIQAAGTHGAEPAIAEYYYE